MAVNPPHRPTTYKPEYCEDLINYYKITHKPTIEGFCHTNDICISTFYDWLKKYDELSEAKDKCWQIRRESFLNEVEDMIITDKDVKINAFPLALIARRYGIKTKDDPDNSAADKLADALKSVVTTYSLPDNGRLNADKATT
jgi:hypothetical protein